MRPQAAETLSQTEKDIVSHGLALALSEAPGTIVIAVLAAAAEIANKLDFTDELRMIHLGNNARCFASNSFLRTHSRRVARRCNRSSTGKPSRFIS